MVVIVVVAVATTVRTKLNQVIHQNPGVEEVVEATEEAEGDIEVVEEAIRQMTMSEKKEQLKVRALMEKELSRRSSIESKEPLIMYKPNKIPGREKNKCIMKIIITSNSKSNLISRGKAVSSTILTTDTVVLGEVRSTRRMVREEATGVQSST